MDELVCGHGWDNVGCKRARTKEEAALDIDEGWVRVTLSVEVTLCPSCAIKLLAKMARG